MEVAPTRADRALGASPVLPMWRDSPPLEASARLLLTDPHFQALSLAPHSLALWRKEPPLPNSLFVTCKPKCLEKLPSPPLSFSPPVSLFPSSPSQERRDEGPTTSSPAKRAEPLTGAPCWRALILPLMHLGHGSLSSRCPGPSVAAHPCSRSTLRRTGLSPMSMATAPTDQSWLRGRAAFCQAGGWPSVRCGNGTRQTGDGVTGTAACLWGLLTESSQQPPFADENTEARKPRRQEPAQACVSLNPAPSHHRPLHQRKDLFVMRAGWGDGEGTHRVSGWPVSRRMESSPAPWAQSCLPPREAPEQTARAPPLRRGWGETQLARHISIFLSAN